MGPRMINAVPGAWFCSAGFWFLVLGSAHGILAGTKNPKPRTGTQNPRTWNPEPLIHLDTGGLILLPERVERALGADVQPFSDGGRCREDRLGEIVARDYLERVSRFPHGDDPFSRSDVQIAARQNR